MKISRFISIILMAVFVLTACGPQTSAEALPPLKVAWLVFNGYGPFFIAQDQGIFEKHNVQVQGVASNTTADEVIALNGNAADCALVVFSDVVVDSEASDLKVVMIIDSTNGADQLIGPADVSNVADLKGKRIGMAFGSYSELFVREVLKKYGVNPGDVQLVNVAPEELPDALGKTVDAGHTYDPYSSQARSRGYKEISSTADVPNLIFDAVACNSSVLQQRPNDVRAFIASWFEALTWWQANEQAGNAIIANATNQQTADISTDGIKLFTLQDNQSGFDPNDPTSLFAAAKKTVDFYTTVGAISRAPDLNTLLDGSFLK